MTHSWRITCGTWLARAYFALLGSAVLLGLLTVFTENEVVFHFGTIRTFWYATGGVLTVAIFGLPLLVVATLLHRRHPGLEDGVYFRNMLRRAARALLALVAVALLVAVTAVIAVVARDPVDGPLAAQIRDVFFFVPGVTHLVEWEGRRDAGRAFRAGRRLLLGYDHGSNVGELPECTIQSYEQGAGQPEHLPPWSGGRGLHGMMAVSCRDSEKETGYEFTVLECGNAWDTYQVVYGRSHNEEMLRLAKEQLVVNRRLTNH